MSNIYKEFTTFQPRLIKPNQITSPQCFNGMCMIRQYKVTVEEIEEPREVLEERLRLIWADKRYGHSGNLKAMRKEAERLGIDLP